MGEPRSALIDDVSSQCHTATQSLHLSPLQDQSHLYVSTSFISAALVRDPAIRHLSPLPIIAGSGYENHTLQLPVSTRLRAKEPGSRRGVQATTPGNPSP